VEQLVKYELEGETKVRGKDPSHFHFIHHTFYMNWPGIELGPPHWEAGD
jgi:hypothetical protein